LLLWLLLVDAFLHSKRKNKTITRTGHGMMIRHILVIVLLAIQLPVFAEELATGFRLSEAPVDPTDIASIKRGAKFFAANCMSCHTLVYLKNDKLAHEAGITYDKMPVNVKSWPYGITPPDLSLEADVRGVDWIYTYLHSFYPDPSRPTGANNLLVPNSAMPNIIGPYQGEQEKLVHPVKDMFGTYQWYDVLKQTKPGTMTADQFDETIRDVVNFLDYAAEPFKVEQHRLGVWVLGFLVILGVMLYFLKREYWKDVKRKK
jgi:ubiquinol-cytochrome c reductase cytochrome c1 subunit